MSTFAPQSIVQPGIVEGFQRPVVRTPDTSGEERELIIADLMALKKERISDFLARRGLPKSGTKEEFRLRIEEALQSKTLTLSQIVLFLDEVIPWGKQHVYLYRGPQSSVANWKNADWLAKRLEEHHLGDRLNASLPLTLPANIEISSIEHNERRLRVTAIRKRIWWERNPEYDRSTQTDQGEDVELRAFVKRYIRSLVAFEWDLLANTAFLQVSQLPTGLEYDDVAGEFFSLVQGWLDIKAFSVVNLRPAIKKLHELEEASFGETRSHGINYRTLQGRSFEAKSASALDPLLGEASIDSALKAVRKAGIGHLGNFYWLPNGESDNETHVIIVAAQNRINFPTPNVEGTIRHILSRIRCHCN